VPTVLKDYKVQEASMEQTVSTVLQDYQVQEASMEQTVSTVLQDYQVQEDSTVPTVLQDYQVQEDSTVPTVLQDYQVLKYLQPGEFLVHHLVPTTISILIIPQEITTKKYQTIGQYKET